MTDKEFRVRHGLVVGNNVLVANVTSNTLTVSGIINAAVIQVNGTTIPSGAVSNLIFDTANAAFDVANTVASDLANTAITANNYAGAMANAANSYAASLTPNLSPVFIVANAAYAYANTLTPLGIFDSTVSTFPLGDFANGEVTLTSHIDAFGIATAPIFDCQDPVGDILTQDLGSDISI